MRFAKHLEDLAAEFRLNEFKSSDVADKTVQAKKWEDFHVSKFAVLLTSHMGLVAIT